MARRARVEVEGGLYHLIARGNNRQDVFHSAEDYARFLTLLAKQKESLGFYLYAYCLMTNHVHLLIERQGEMVGRVMQRLLTGYSQYYNRRYRRVGHVFQGRHKAILCQSEGYLGKLVRYIHLNPVRARMVGAAELYPYSSHGEYIGIKPVGITDVDPVLRLFGNRREDARRHFAEYVRAGAGSSLADDLYPVDSGILGSDEFVDETIHRLGDIGKRIHRRVVEQPVFDREALFSAVEAVFGLPRDEFCGTGKNARAVMAKELLILTGREAGAGFTELSAMTGIDSSNISRRYDAAKQSTESDPKHAYAKRLVGEKYRERIAESQA